MPKPKDKQHVLAGLKQLAGDLAVMYEGDGYDVFDDWEVGEMEGLVRDAIFVIQQSEEE